MTSFMKLFFSDTSKAAGAGIPQVFSDDRSTTDSDSKPEYVTVFDGTEPLSAASPSLVIPPIPNSEFRAAKKMKNVIPPADYPDVTSETEFLFDTSGADAPVGSIPYGLTIRESKPKEEAEEVAALRRFREETKNFPVDLGMEEVADVSVENFATAVLAGYGWKEGMGIGRRNKKDVEVVQHDRRQGMLCKGFKEEEEEEGRTSGFGYLEEG